MDIQLKRGLLDVCVLTAIKNGESYGYKIIKDTAPYVQMSLTVRSAEHDGRLRKYYKITESGLNRIGEFKDEWREVMSIYKFVTKEDASDEKA